MSSGQITVYTKPKHNRRRNPPIKRTFGCKECNRCYGTIYALNYHIDTKHNGLHNTRIEPRKDLTIGSIVVNNA